VGAYLALMAFYHQSEHHVIPPFNEDIYRMILEKMYIKPSVLLIGYGTVGKACKAVLDQFDIPCTVVISKDIITKALIFQHSILIHAIRLSDDVSICPSPFLLPSDLVSTGKLSIICDISCDLGNPRNLLPIYSSYTTATHPVVALTPTVDLIAISNLPSLDAHVSSEQFSSTLVSYLPELPYFQYTKEIHSHAAVLSASYDTFCHIRNKMDL
jgi:alanine dehydrogenase